MASFEYRGPIRLVVFDWAGTTVDHGCFAPVVPFVDAFAAEGIEISLATARGPMGLHKKDHVRTLGRLPEVSAKWQQQHGRAFEETDVERMYARLLEPEVTQTIAERSSLIDETLPAVEQLRSRGIKIGATTGYFREAAEPVAARAAEAGFQPDLSLCVDDVPAGRPAPWGIFRTMQELEVFPPAAVVKVGDTVPDIGEGRNAGAWSVGVTRTGNEVGLTATEFAELRGDRKRGLLATAEAKLREAGAHFVVESVADVPKLVQRIEHMLSGGQRP